MNYSLKKFRYDINGLRAYAVTLVVLFHFKILGFSAGFIGVDIFFVISGYLMTKIIISQIMQNNFSLWRFYLARGVRILPALLVLTLVIAGFSWILLTPEDYQAYAKHAASSITFLSNILYWRESSDYFSAAAHDKILLHTWSLSVEWQFYIILPIILIIISKVKKSQFLLNSSIPLLFFASLLLSYKISQTDQTTAFYMIPTRAWEMLAGGIVYLYFSQITLSNITKRVVEILGFSLIAISLLIFKADTVWPSINALLPVLGSMLILIAKNNTSILTKPKIFQWLGNSSYSIYLWHWPIVFFIGYLGYQNNHTVIALGILSSLILGWLSYKFIETSSRKYLTSLVSIKGIVLLSLVTLISLSLFAAIFLKNGIPQRASTKYLNETKDLVMPTPNNGWCFYTVDSIKSLPVGKGVIDCKVGGTEDSKYKALLFGDSFAGHNIPFWDQIGKDLNTQVQAITTNWCYPSLVENQYTGLKSSRAYEQCNFNKQFLAKNISNYDYLIFAGHWKQIFEKGQIENFNNLLAEANKLNVPILIMASPYSFDLHVVNYYKQSAWLGRNFKIDQRVDPQYDKTTVEANEIVKNMGEKYSNVIFIGREELYSPTHLTKQGYPYSLDGKHLNLLGSKESAKYFKNSTIFHQLKLKLE